MGAWPGVSVIRDDAPRPNRSSVRRFVGRWRMTGSPCTAPASATARGPEPPRRVDANSPRHDPPAGSGTL